jgi:hypothetical protein
MATPQDFSLNVVEETTYGTYVAPTRAVEYLDGTELLTEVEFYDGMGMKSGNRAANEDRAIETQRGVTGKIVTEATTKGLGRLLKWAAGDSASTLVSGSTYQQNFYPGDTPASFTAQQGVPETTSGTVNVYSYLGCMISGWSFSVGRGAEAKFEFDVVGRSLDTGQSLASLTYPSGYAVYSFKDVAATYGGTVTAPTTTALASGGTSATNILEFNLQVDNKLNIDRRYFGSAGLRSKPIVGGYREITGSFTAAYEGTAYRDDYLANTSRSLVVTLTSSSALSTGYATLQFVLPAIKLRSAPIVSNNGDLVEVTYDFKAYQSASFTHPYWICLRSSDTAL